MGEEVVGCFEDGVDWVYGSSSTLFCPMGSQCQNGSKNICNSVVISKCLITEAVMDDKVELRNRPDETGGQQASVPRTHNRNILQPHQTN